MRQMITYPKYMKSKVSGLIVKFIDTTKGEVIDPGYGDRYDIGEIISTFVPHTDQSIWENVSHTWLENRVKMYTESIGSLTFFQTLPMENSSSTLTKVPNGYVMTSHSGHQLFIKENTKETL